MILFAVNFDDIKFEEFPCTNTKYMSYNRTTVRVPIGKDGKLPQCHYCHEDSLTEQPTTSPGK